MYASMVLRHVLSTPPFTPFLYPHQKDEPSYTSALYLVTDGGGYPCGTIRATYHSIHASAANVDCQGRVKEKLLHEV